jgi:hypothetical protein
MAKKKTRKLRSKPNHKIDSALHQWLDKINYKQRVKAVCKPCWELKYCPYGPLVEDFPLAEQGDERSCRIFGHICPVFSVAEPFTETKELRRIDRTIPRPVKFRVLRREHGVCRSCNLPIRDEDIHFDHIIPWSKGGPSEESNIQLLCGKCNRTKSDRFERDHLVASVSDHLSDPVGVEFLEMLKYIIGFSHHYYAENDNLPTHDEIASFFGVGDPTPAESHAAQLIADVHAFFNSQPPSDLSKKVFAALHERWGFVNNRIRRLRTIAKKHGVSERELLEADVALVNRLGWTVKSDVATRDRWLKR